MLAYIWLICKDDFNNVNFNNIKIYAIIITNWLQYIKR